MTIYSVVAVLKEHPRGLALLVAGDFNTSLDHLYGDRRGKEIVTALMAAVLEYMLDHFLLRWCPWFRDGSTRNMIRLGRKVRSRTKLILGKDCRLLRNMAIQDPRHNLD